MALEVSCATGAALWAHYSSCPCLPVPAGSRLAAGNTRSALGCAGCVGGDAARGASDTMLRTTAATDGTGGVARPPHTEDPGVLKFTPQQSEQLVAASKQRVQLCPHTGVAMVCR